MSQIRVLCRFRPQNSIEDERGGTQCVEYLSPTTCRVKSHEFTFDRVYAGASTQADIYEEVSPAVADLLEGYNATIFAYGQTSSGKTFTMQGPDIDDAEMRGVIPRVVHEIFARIQRAPEHVEFQIRASYLEIYLERIRDLLDARRDNLKVREDRTKGVFVDGQKEVFVASVAEVFEVLRIGQHNRAVAATGMNQQSSRSHSVFLLGVTARNTRDQTTRMGKLYLVDLAGSEKVGKTGAVGLTLNEAKMINKSLSALGNVIKALTDGKSQHIPYRDSKLTRILQESLGGNARTSLIICCSPSSYNEDETVSTLRFGIRAKTIKNKARANVDRSPAELKAMLAKAEAEIEQLKGVIAALRAGGGNGGEGSGGGPSGEKLLEMTEKLEATQKQLEAVQDEKTQLLDAQEAIRDSLAEKTLELERQTATMAELSARSAELQASSTEAQFLLRSANTKLEEAGVEIEALRKENERLKTEVDEFQMQQELRGYSASSDASSPQHGDDSTFFRPRGGSMAVGESRDYSLAEADIRQTLQQGFERVRMLGSRLLDGGQAPTESDVQGALIEIRALGEQLATTPLSMSPIPVAMQPAATSATVAAASAIEEEKEAQHEHVNSAETSAAEEPAVAPAPEEPKHSEIETSEKPTEQEEEKHPAEAAVSPAVAEPVAPAAPAPSQEQLREEAIAAVRHEFEQKIAELTARSEALVAQNESLRQDSGIVGKLQAELVQIREVTEKKLGELSRVREALLSDLENRCLRVVDLQIQLDEMSERYEALRKTKVVSSERQLRQQVLTQQREIQKNAREMKKLASENQRLQDEDAAVRKQLGIRVDYVRQLEAEISNLQKSLREVVIQQVASQQQIQQLQQQLQQHQQQQPAGESTPHAPRIARPIRGGVVVAGVSPVSSRGPPSPSSVSLSPSSSMAAGRQQQTLDDDDTDTDGDAGDTDSEYGSYEDEEHSGDAKGSMEESSAPAASALASAE